MKKIYLLLLFSIFFIGCDKKDELKDNQEEKKPTEWVPSNDYAYFRITNKTTEKVMFERRYTSGTYDLIGYIIEPNSMLLDSFSMNSLSEYYPCIQYSVDLINYPDDGWIKPKWEFQPFKDTLVPEYSTSPWRAYYKLVGGRVLDIDLVFAQ